MTDLMKRYEAETGKKARDELYSGSIKLYMPTNDYIAWLESQLRWRPVSEKPEKDELIVIKYANGHIPSVLLYGGSTPWESIVELYGISGWFSIPPALEGE